MGADPCTTPSAPCSKYASTTSGDYRRERREYPILTWHTQNETTRQRHEKKSSLFDQIYHNYLPVTFRYAHSANYSFYHQMSSKLTKHNRIKKIGHQIHRKHYITPNNLSLDLADWWNRNNHKKRHIIPGCNNLFCKECIWMNTSITNWCHTSPIYCLGTGVFNELGTSLWSGTIKGKPWVHPAISPLEGAGWLECS